MLYIQLLWEEESPPKAKKFCSINFFLKFIHPIFLVGGKLQNFLIYYNNSFWIFLYIQVGERGEIVFLLILVKILLIVFGILFLLYVSFHYGWTVFHSWIFSVLLIQPVSSYFSLPKHIRYFFFLLSTSLNSWHRDNCFAFFSK